MTDHRDLQHDFLNGRITRRQFIVRSLALGVSLSSIGSFLAACAPQAVSTPQAGSEAAMPTEMEEQKLIIAGAKDIRSLDPHQTNDIDSALIYELVHDTVALLDPEFNVEPNLAESWEVSEDGLTYTFHFREGVQFHDGTELTADEVVFSINRILTNEFPGGEGKRVKIEMIDSFEATDDYTVEITLQFPYAPFPAAFGVQHILPQKAVEEMGDDEYGKRPVGCGPFKAIDWVPNDHVQLEAFADYWRMEPALDEVTVRPIPENAVAVANLISGDVDVITDVVGSNLPQLREASDRGVEILTEPGFSYYFAGFRMMSPPFTDLRFRKAVYMATDFDAATKAIFPPEIATRAYGTVPPGLWPQDEAYLKSIALPQDQEESRRLFDELIDEGVMDADYAITIVPPPDDARIRVGEIMATNLQEVGVKVELLLVEWATFREVRSGEQNIIYMLGTVPAIPDPDANVRWLFHQNGTHGTTLNIAGYDENAEWEAQIERAQQISDRDERAQIYRDLVRTFMENVFHIPLYHKNAVAAKRDYVKELEVSKLPRWDLVKPWANVHIEGRST